MSAMEPADPYFILGVERNASIDDIKRAYRRLARDFHPDRNPENPEAAERFQEVRAAYDQIGTDQKKREWDALHVNPFQSYGTVGSGPQGFSSLFKQPPQPGQRARPAMRGRDIETEVQISFEAALQGTTADVDFSVDEVCDRCEGDRSFREVCPLCGGSGLETGEDHLATRICPTCQGDEKVPCTKCGGSGRIKDTRRHRVKIPAGVDDGTRIRISGKGGPGASGGQPGDLYVVTRVAPSEVYERRGADLILDVPVTYPEAVLGANVILPTPDGPISLKVPAGSLPGRLLRVRGRGMARLGETARGDLYARIAITLPDRLTEDERDLLETLKEVSSEMPRQHFFPDGMPLEEEELEAES
jgi:molecular chaperone DnaJ